MDTRIITVLLLLILGCGRPSHRVGGPGPEPFSPPLVLTPADAAAGLSYVTSSDGGVAWRRSSSLSPVLGRDLYGTAADAGVASAMHGAIAFSDAGTVTCANGTLACGMVQPSSDAAAPPAMAFTPAGSTNATAGAGGLMAVNIVGATGVANEGGWLMKRGSQSIILIGPYNSSGFANLYSGIYIGSASAIGTAGSANYTLLAEDNGALTYLNAASSTGALTFRIGGTEYANLSTTGFTFDNSIIGGYIGLTISNCNGTPVLLTATQSAANNLNIVTCSTGTTTTEVQSANPPSGGRMLFFRNSASVTTITFGWSTGSTCSILTGTSALLTSDGTNCVKLMAGT